MSDTQPTAAQPPEQQPQVQSQQQSATPPPSPPSPPSPPPVPPVPPVPPATTAYATPPEADPPRFRDRLFALLALIAVAIAGVVLGGLAGFGIQAAADGDGRYGRMGRFG